MIRQDAYYTKYGPTGVKHPRFPRWGHKSYYIVRMCHKALPLIPGCVSTTIYRLGIVGYWDGSKKLVW